MTAARSPRPAASQDSAEGAARGVSSLPGVLVAVAVFVDMLLYGLVVPIVPGYARSLGAGTGLIGIIFAAYAVGMFAASPLAALLTKRIGPRWSLVAGGTGIIASTLVWAAAGDVGVLAAARAVQGAAAAVTWTAGLAFVAARYGPERRGRLMGWVMTAMAAGLVLGAPAGGTLAGAFGYQTPFLLVAGLAAGEVLAFWRLIPQAGPGQAPAPLRIGIRGLAADPPARYVLLAVLAASTALSTAEPLLPLRLTRDLGASSGAIGILFGITMVAYAAASPVAGSLTDRIGPTWLIAAGLIGMAVVTAVLPRPPTMLTQAVVLAVLGLCLAAVLTPGLAALGHSAGTLPGADYELTYALFNVVYAGGMLLGPIEGGLVAQGTSLPVAFAVTGALCLVPLAAIRGASGRSRPPQTRR